MQPTKAENESKRDGDDFLIECGDGLSGQCDVGRMTTGRGEKGDRGRPPFFFPWGKSEASERTEREIAPKAKSTKHDEQTDLLATSRLGGGRRRGGGQGDLEGR